MYEVGSSANDCIMLQKNSKVQVEAEAQGPGGARLFLGSVDFSSCGRKETMQTQNHTTKHANIVAFFLSLLLFK